MLALNKGFNMIILNGKKFAANDKEFTELGGRLLLTIHDEILGEAPKENALKALERMETLMVEASNKYLSLPMKCDGVITERWEGNNLKQSLMEEQDGV